MRSWILLGLSLCLMGLWVSVDGQGPYESRDAIFIDEATDMPLQGIGGLGTQGSPFRIQGYHIQGPETAITIIDQPTFYFLIENNMLQTDGGLPAIHVENVAGLTIRGNALIQSSNGAGIDIREQQNLLIEDNTIQGGLAGVKTNFLPPGAIIRGNNITSSDGAGVLLQGSDGQRVEDNLIHNSSIGVSLTLGAKDAVVTGNRIVDNDFGISIDEDSTDAHVYNNWFANALNAKVAASSTTWSISPTPGANVAGTDRLAGNYWSDYKGLDSNDDRIGDTSIPYKKGMASGDLYPIMAPYEPPIVELVASPQSGGRPVDAEFTVSVDGTATITSITWDYGDGTIETGDMHTEYLYDVEGDYLMQVTVTDSAGSTISREALMEIGPAIPPELSIDATPRIGGVPLVVDFTATVIDDGANTVTWDFGDGNSGEGEFITHTYTELGDYYPTATTVDASGLSDSETLHITVNDAPPDLQVVTTQLTTRGDALHVVEALAYDQGGPIEELTISDGSFESLGPVTTRVVPRLDSLLITARAYAGGQETTVNEELLAQNLAAPAMPGEGLAQFAISDGELPLDARVSLLPQTMHNASFIIDWGDGHVSEAEVADPEPINPPVPFGTMPMVTATASGVVFGGPWDGAIHAWHGDSHWSVEVQSHASWGIDENGYLLHVQQGAEDVFEFVDVQTGNVVQAWTLHDDAPANATVFEYQGAYYLIGGRFANGLWNQNILRLDGETVTEETLTDAVAAYPRVCPTSTGIIVQYSNKTAIHDYDGTSFSVSHSIITHDDGAGACHSSFYVEPRAGIITRDDGALFSDAPLPYTPSGQHGIWHGPTQSLWWFGEDVQYPATHVDHLYESTGVMRQSTRMLVDNGTATWMVPLQAEELNLQLENPHGLHILAAPGSGHAPLNTGFVAQFADQGVEGSTFSWDFGDGSMASEPYVSHRFYDPGTYHVRLVAITPDGLLNRAFTTVTVFDPSASFHAHIQYQETSDGIHHFSPRLTGATWHNIETIRWELEDGRTFTQRDLQLEFASSGTYNISLFARTDDGLTSRDRVSIAIEESPPDGLARILVTAARGQAPSQHEFRVDSDYQVETYLWDFGDGSFSNQANPTHRFLGPGVYEVTLHARSQEAFDEHNVPALVASKTVRVKSGGFIVGIPEPCSAPCHITLQAAIPDLSGTWTCLWSFKDGSEVPECNVRHEFIFTKQDVVNLDLYRDGVLYARDVKSVLITDDSKAAPGLGLTGVLLVLGYTTWRRHGATRHP